jgi:hypothetical protein
MIDQYSKNNFYKLLLWHFKNLFLLYLSLKSIKFEQFHLLIVSKKPLYIVRENIE